MINPDMAVQSMEFFEREAHRAYHWFQKAGGLDEMTYWQRVHDLSVRRWIREKNRYLDWLGGGDFGHTVRV